MKMLRMWRNGESGEIVQAIIEHNFKILGKNLQNHILALSTTERNTMHSDYLKEGLIVYDIDFKKWFQYQSGVWVRFPLGSSSYTQLINSTDWNENNEITIKYSMFEIENPIVTLYYLNSDYIYEEVAGGVYIKDDYTIILKSDLPFNGKVVVR